jgi:hypothetical protein
MRSIIRPIVRYGIFNFLIIWTLCATASLAAQDDRFRSGIDPKLGNYARTTTSFDPNKPIEKKWCPGCSDTYNLVKTIEEELQGPLQRYGMVVAGTLNPNSGMVEGVPQPVRKSFEFLTIRFIIGRGDVKEWTVRLEAPMRMETLRNQDGRSSSRPSYQEKRGTGPGNADLFIGRYFDDRHRRTPFNYTISWAKNNGQRGSVTGSFSMMLDPQRRVYVGAMLIPALPVAIIYAPPVDRSRSNVVAYSQGFSMGTTYSTSFTTERATTEPGTISSSAPYVARDALKGIASIGAALPTPAAPAFAVLGQIMSAVGSDSDHITKGSASSFEAGYRADYSVSATDTTELGKGPGKGDKIVFMINAEIGWIYDPIKQPHDTWAITGGPASLQYVVLNPQKKYLNPTVEMLLEDYHLLTGNTYQGNPRSNLAHYPPYAVLASRTAGDPEFSPKSSSAPVKKITLSDRSKLLLARQEILNRFRDDKLGTLHGNKGPNTNLTVPTILSLLDLDGFATLVEKGYPLDSPTPSLRQPDLFAMEWGLDTSEECDHPQQTYPFFKNKRYILSPDSPAHITPGTGARTFSITTGNWSTTTDTKYETLVHQWSTGWLGAIMTGGSYTEAVVSTTRLVTSAGTSATSNRTTSVQFNAQGGEAYCVDAYYDTAFGTYAFVRVECPAEIETTYEGWAADANGRALPNQEVTLTIGGKTFRTKTDSQGRYQFRSVRAFKGTQGTITYFDRNNKKFMKPAIATEAKQIQNR